MRSYAVCATLSTVSLSCRDTVPGESAVSWAVSYGMRAHEDLYAFGHVAPGACQNL